MADALEALLVSQNRVVNRHRLATLMEDLFYTNKKFKDEQIQRELSEPSTGPFRAVGMGPSSDHSLVARGITRKERPFRWWHAVLGGLALLVLGISIVVLARMGSRSSKTASPDPTPKEQRASSPPPDQNRAPLSAPRPDASVPRTITIALDVIPPLATAEVVFRGKTFKGANFKVMVQHSVTPEEITVRAPGHQEKKIIIEPSANWNMAVPLVAAPSHSSGMRPPPRKPPMTGPGFRWDIAPRPRK
jgi:hypothetical protein